MAALQEADGTLAVINIMEGSSSTILTCSKLRQCLSQAHSIKPIMVLTKLNHAFLKLQLVNLQTTHTHTQHTTHTHHHTHTHHTANGGGAMS